MTAKSEWDLRLEHHPQLITCEVITIWQPREFPQDTMISFVDRFTAPKWFKSISEKDFDDGNYLPAIYSIDSATGASLWEQSAAVPLPVMVRYLCEYFASDLKAELSNIQCPVLVLRATFSEQVLLDPMNTYVKPQFIDTWNNAAEKNRLIRVTDIVWKDNPTQTYREVRQFLSRLE